MPRYFSPAKINLFLRVLGRQTNGYHALYTQMQAVDLFDELEIELAHVDQLSFSSGVDLPTDSSNLILKATSLFRQKTGLDVYFTVHCLKRIPHRAGFGGGSSNAATTLFACAHLCGIKVSEHELQQWSAQLGSDCPFFFSSGAALCQGRGEIVENVEAAAHEAFYLCMPPYGLSTADVFREYCKQDVQDTALDCLFVNDLEAPAFRLNHVLAALKQELKQEYKKVVMSGSGTGFVCAEGVGRGQKVRPVSRQQGQWYTSCLS